MTVNMYFLSAVIK